MIHKEGNEKVLCVICGAVLGTGSDTHRCPSCVNKDKTTIESVKFSGKIWEDKK